ncbi:protein ASPARTIC PROTEASE IN GUARD CELL 2-like [Pyrus ussuriensis x Pyrus communis]|uniref:Protein ASPARTIC PROTEASE IN GUARD CELL 2-like n=1 Tax=Pyrus ussuriensis x Pyrus communis TaxID=2448454 RepID=A0A5N5HIZ6_9ROSA|nr:protein ASPARTIC PROTEASE IN GUARD CELL 2-like [Pyrus ussuriensis x Pyrus communis]
MATSWSAWAWARLRRNSRSYSAPAATSLGHNANLVFGLVTHRKTHLRPLSLPLTPTSPATLPRVLSSQHPVLLAVVPPPPVFTANGLETAPSQSASGPKRS